ncbi:MAG: hypothetical protein JXB88_20770 [Spirochaetales bacterium]|nr:hypothetical protein [Spirochaetales bacterium]
MKKITENTRAEVKDIIFDFLADACEIEKSELNEDMKIIEELGGDSLMFLSMLEIFKKKYNLNVELKAIGKYILKHPAETIGEIIDATLVIIEYENRIVDM